MKKLKLHEYPEVDNETEMAKNKFFYLWLLICVHWDEDMLEETISKLT